MRITDRQIPEFDAYEMNELIRRARANYYYDKCLKFVKDTVLNDDLANQDLTDKQVKWLWGIKRDLKDALND